MNTGNITSNFKQFSGLGTNLLIIGTSLVLIATFLFFLIGINLDTAIANKTYGDYLNRSHEMHVFLVLQVSLGMIGFYMISLALNSIACYIFESNFKLKIMEHCTTISGALVLVSGFALIAINTKMYSETISSYEMLFQVFAWFASRTFWISMILLFGIPAFLISTQSEVLVLPEWYKLLGWIVGFCALLTVVSFLTHALDNYGAWLFPAGIIWLVLSIILFKHKNAKH